MKTQSSRLRVNIGQVKPLKLNKFNVLILINEQLGLYNRPTDQDYIEMILFIFFSTLAQVASFNNGISYAVYV